MPWRAKVPTYNVSEHFKRVQSINGGQIGHVLEVTSQQVVKIGGMPLLESYESALRDSLTVAESLSLVSTTLLWVTQSLQQSLRTCHICCHDLYEHYSLRPFAVRVWMSATWRCGDVAIGRWRCVTDCSIP